MDLSTSAPTSRYPPKYLDKESPNDEDLEEEESLLGRFRDKHVYGKKGEDGSPASRWTKWLVVNVVFTVINLGAFITLLVLFYYGHVVYNDRAKFLLPPCQFTLSIPDLGYKVIDESEWYFFGDHSPRN
jgi:hypothetical protein